MTRDEQRLPKVSHYAKLKEELWVYLLPPVASVSLQLEIPGQQRSLGQNNVPSPPSRQVSVPAPRLGFIAVAEGRKKNIGP